MRSSAWLVVLWLVASCGLNFDRYEPIGSVDGSTEDASDGGSGVVEDGTPTDSGGAPDSSAAQDGAPIQEASLGCTTSGACQGSAPVCNPATHQCVQCLATSDCRAPAPYCNSQSFMCATGCTSDTECSGATPYCNPTSAACVQCITSTN